MSFANPSLTPEQLAQLGIATFDRCVQPALRPEDDGKYAAIDVLSGDFELDVDDYAAVAQLRVRRPDAEVWLERVGQAATYHLRRAR